jgi:N-acyl-D-amino-acid deacylase
MGRTFDILIKGGLLYDGGLSAPFISDIGIADGMIRFIGRSDEKKAEKIIDARGFAVCPGFIDAHSHSDFTIVADPRAEGKICQGITTEINGNCGMSAAPLFKKALEKREEDLRELGIRDRWNTFSEYFALLAKRGLAVNMAFLAGHGNIRGSVVGYDDKEPSHEELDGMAALMEEAIGQGAIGLSTGLIYPPGIYSGTEELIHIARVLLSRDLIYASHMRSEGARLTQAVEEVIRIGEESGVKVHISHIKTAGERNWQKAEDVLSLLNEARGRGLKITCDRYPYIASSTDLDAILPSWVFEGGNDEELRRLLDRKEKDKIAMEMREQSGSHGYWEKVIVSSVASEKNRWMEGKTIAEISRVRRNGEMEAVFEILLEEKLRVGAIFLSMKEENLRKFLSLPYCMIGSDSSARSFDGPTKKGKPHPRTFGTFPRFFGNYVLKVGLLSLPEAIYKATRLTAQTFGLRKRGGLKEGFYADIVVFDAGRIMDKSTYADPFQMPEGIAYVLVNGIPAVWEGVPSGKLAGKVLKGNNN